MALLVLYGFASQLSHLDAVFREYKVVMIKLAVFGNPLQIVQIEVFFRIGVNNLVIRLPGEGCRKALDMVSTGPFFCGEPFILVKYCIIILKRIHNNHNYCQYPTDIFFAQQICDVFQLQIKSEIKWRYLKIFFKFTCIAILSSYLILQVNVSFQSKIFWTIFILPRGLFGWKTNVAAYW